MANLTAQESYAAVEAAVARYWDAPGDLEMRAAIEALSSLATGRRLTPEARDWATAWAAWVKAAAAATAEAERAERAAWAKAREAAWAAAPGRAGKEADMGFIVDDLRRIVERLEDLAKERARLLKMTPADKEEANRQLLEEERRNDDRQS